jgi:hypothetical protein
MFLTCDINNKWFSLRHLAYSWNLTIVIFFLWVQVRQRSQVISLLWLILFWRIFRTLFTSNTMTGLLLWCCHLITLDLNDSKFAGISECSVQNHEYTCPYANWFAVRTIWKYLTLQKYWSELWSDENLKSYALKRDEPRSFFFFRASVPRGVTLASLPGFARARSLVSGWVFHRSPTVSQQRRATRLVASPGPPVATSLFPMV